MFCVLVAAFLSNCNYLSVCAAICFRLTPARVYLPFITTEFLFNTSRKKISQYTWNAIPGRWLPRVWKCLRIHDIQTVLKKDRGRCFWRTGCCLRHLLPLKGNPETTYKRFSVSYSQKELLAYVIEALCKLFRYISLSALKWPVVKGNVGNDTGRKKRKWDSGDQF